jgi:multiple sugar transport system substrate-binding protein
MKPTINSPEAVQALEYLMELSKYAPAGFPSYGWEESATAFMQGKVASGLLFSDWIPSFKDPNSSKVAGNWNFARVPAGKAGAGSGGDNQPGYQRGLRSGGQRCRVPLPQMGHEQRDTNPVGEDRLLSHKLSVLDSAEFSTPEYRYFKGLKDTYDITKTPMKIPEFFELNDALSIELSAAVAGQKTAKQALDAAQDSWTKIMAKAGY